MREENNRERAKLFLEIGLLLFVAIVISTANNMDSVKWLFTNHSDFQTTSGKITSSRVAYNGSPGGWRFLITYEYSVDEKIFVSDRIHYGYQALLDEDYAKNFVENYPTEKVVTVYYNPIDPQISVLEPDVKWYGALYFPGLALIMDLTLFIISYQLFKKNPL